MYRLATSEPSAETWARKVANAWFATQELGVAANVAVQRWLMLLVVLVDALEAGFDVVAQVEVKQLR